MSIAKNEDYSREKIDKQLENAGWECIDDTTKNTGYSTKYIIKNNHKPDYTLLIDGIPIAYVEAKKPSINASSTKSQLETYSKNTKKNKYSPDYKDFGVKYLYGANDSNIVFYDFTNKSPRSRELTKYHTKDDLLKMNDIDYEKAFEYLNNNPAKSINSKLWEHQAKCSDNIFEFFEKGQISTYANMTTGSGKTTMSKITAHRFLQAELGQKVLYIPNKKNLSTQAYKSYKNFSPDNSNTIMNDLYDIQNLIKNEKDYKQADIVITTGHKIYTMMNKDNINFSLKEFDLIIYDESHAYIFNNKKMGRLFTEFDSYNIGLTATPTQSTRKLFDFNEAYEYTYEDGVKDGHLVPFNAQRIETNITMNGLETDDGKIYNSDEIGRNIHNRETNRVIGNEIREHIEKEQNKNIENEHILIFACNDDHASRITEDLQRYVFSDKRDDFIHKATYESRYPQQSIDLFKDSNKKPNILVTVGMVKEGVDIPHLEHIVMMRPVKSPVAYNQMIGRGTRTFKNKKQFTIYDCVGIIDYYDEKGYGPFNTKNYESNIQGSNIQKSNTNIEPKIVQKEDEVILSETIFRLESGKELNKKQFKENYINVLNSIEKDIKWMEHSSKNIKELENKISSKILEQDNYLEKIFIKQAFDEYKEEMKYIDFIYKILYNLDLNKNKRINYAVTKLQEEYNIPTNDNLIRILKNDECIENLEKSDFQEYPLAHFGWSGVKKRTNNKPNEFIKKYNKLQLRYIIQQK